MSINFMLESQLLQYFYRYRYFNRENKINSLNYHSFRVFNQTTLFCHTLAPLIHSLDLLTITLISQLEFLLGRSKIRTMKNKTYSTDQDKKTRKQNFAFLLYSRRRSICVISSSFQKPWEPHIRFRFVQIFKKYWIYVDPSRPRQIYFSFMRAFFFMRFLRQLVQLRTTLRVSGIYGDKSIDWESGRLKSKYGR